MEVCWIYINVLLLPHCKSKELNLNPYNTYLLFDLERLSALLKKLFETHVSGDVTEELVKV